MSDINYLTPVISGVEHAADWQKFVAAIIVGSGLILIGRSLTKRLRGKSGEFDSESLEKAVIPEEKIGLFGFFDVFIEGFIKFHDSIVGKENRRFVPFTGSVFMFVLTCNLLGLVPGVPAVTTTVWVNVGLALVVFIYFNYLGIKSHGLKHYLAHFAGPAATTKDAGFGIMLILWVLALFLFPLEIFSTALRVVTLNLRLYWNISADHVVLGIFTDLLGDLASVLSPILVTVFYVLGTFVSFMQAFIFTILTMVYILLATQHEEDH